MKELKLNELTLENLSDWPKQYKFGAIFVLCIFIIGLGYYLLITSKLQTYESLKRQEKELKARFERKQHLASNLQKYRMQMEMMQNEFGTMLKKLPTKNEMPGLLEDISRTGIASGLTFELFAPQPEIKYDFYIELPIKVEVVGDYHELAIFLSRVAQLGRIVTIHDFVIQRAGKDKQLSSGGPLIMKLTAKIYRYRSK
tara:strand:+ start:116 stop:712 length:597 start_codon:yes stop_codon:yes gene_type:complete